MSEAERKLAGAIRELDERVTRCEVRIKSAAALLEAMTNDVGFPINSPHKTREWLRELAALLRDEG